MRMIDRTRTGISLSPLPLICLCTAVAAIPSAQATNHYVSPTGNDGNPSYTSWATAARTIQAAIVKASGGDTIWVTNGTFTLSSQITVNKAVTIRSVNGPNATFIDGNGTYRCFSVVSGALLSGLAITNGAAQNGAGIYCDGGGTVSNCVIAYNSASSTGLGGGVYFNGGGTVTASILKNNFAGYDGGGAYLANGGSLLNSTIDHNAIAYDGAGIFVEQAGTVANCTVMHNVSEYGYGGGVLLNNGGTLKNSLIHNNNAGWSFDGGGVYIDMAGTVQDCAIFENQAGPKGGGLFAYGGNVRNCTITDNSCPNFSSEGGGLYAANNATIINSIIYYNEADNGATANCTNRPGVTMTYCCTWPSISGTGNMTNEPGFLDLPGEYHIASDSPCVNAGGPNQAWMITDVDGQPRRYDGGAVDIGADEYSAPPPGFYAFIWPNGAVDGVEGQTIGTLDGSYSATPSGRPLMYRWYYGDGTSSEWSTAPTCNHTYINDGSYDITLLVVNDVAMDSFSISAVIVNKRPVVTLNGPYTNYVGELLTVTATGSDGGEADELQYRFKFGDGDWGSWSALSPWEPIAYVKQASAQFSQVGTSTVWVEIRDDSGSMNATNSDSKTVTVLHNVNPNIGGPYAGAEGGTLLFDGSASTKHSGSDIQYRWQFEEGGSWTAWSASPTTSHIYPDEGSGSYELTLMASNNLDSCSVSTTVAVSNVPPSITSVDLSANEVWLEAPLAVTVDSSDPGSGDTLEYSFNFDGSWTQWYSSNTIQHVCTNGGTQTVYARVRDNDGATSAVASAGMNVIVAQCGSTDVEADNLLCRWSVVADQHYLIQRATSLIEPDWTNVADIITTGTNIIEFVDTNCPPAAFYRAVHVQ